MEVPLEDLQLRIMRLGIRDVEPSIFIDFETLHLTLGMLSLPTRSAQNEAAALLEQLRPQMYVFNYHPPQVIYILSIVKRRLRALSCRSMSAASRACKTTRVRPDIRNVEDLIVIFLARANVLYFQVAENKPLYDICGAYM